MTSDDSTSEGSLLQPLLSRLGLVSGDVAPADWKLTVDECWWYQGSCFAYCVAGGLTLLAPEPLERHMQLFPWQLLGLTVFSNGFFSYLADVETWCRPSSAWKSADLLLATCNTLACVAIALLAAAGHATFPAEATACLGTGVLLGLICKRCAAAASRRGDCDGFLRWHTAWHLSIPAGAIAGQLLLHRACDWRRGGCGCPS